MDHQDRRIYVAGQFEEARCPRPIHVEIVRIEDQTVVADEVLRRDLRLLDIDHANEGHAEISESLHMFLVDLEDLVLVGDKKNWARVRRPSPPQFLWVGPRGAR